MRRKNTSYNSFSGSKHIRKEPNQFIGNSGAARSMKVMGFEEHDDPSLTYIFGQGAFPDIPSDPRDTLGELYEDTEAEICICMTSSCNLLSHY